MLSSRRAAPTPLIITVVDAFTILPGGWSGQTCASPFLAAFRLPMSTLGEPMATAPPWTQGSVMRAACWHIQKPPASVDLHHLAQDHHVATGRLDRDVALRLEAHVRAVHDHGGLARRVG